METVIFIDNLKCGGCATTIKKSLSRFAEIEKTEVKVEEEKITLFHQKEIPLNEIKEQLSALGYPEKGTTQGFKKITANAKSYISCAIGKLTEEKTN